jgi:hypothetical protein
MTSFLIGTPGGTRTPNLMVRTHLLYPVELPGHFGAGGRNRTAIASLENLYINRYTTPAECITCILYQIISVIII